MILIMLELIISQIYIFHLKYKRTRYLGNL